jgi:hypothetical protein
MFACDRLNGAHYLCGIWAQSSACFQLQCFDGPPRIPSCSIVGDGGAAKSLAT